MLTITLRAYSTFQNAYHSKRNWLHCEKHKIGNCINSNCGAQNSNRVVTNEKTPWVGIIFSSDTLSQPTTV
jgi:hypothetical protein